MKDKELEQTLDDLTVNASSITDSIDAIYDMVLNGIDVTEDQLMTINQISGLLRAVSELSAKNNELLNKLSTAQIKKGK